MQVTSMKVGDLFPRPRLRLQADGVGVDLSEAVSVTARVRLPGSTSHVDRDVTVADQDVTANHGIVTVVLIDGDTDFQGTIKFDIEVEWATGVQTWPSRGYFKIWLLEDADSAQGGGPPLVGSSGDPFTLDRIYDVNISSVADNDLLQYDSTSARWLNVAPADVRSTLGLGSAALSSSTDFIRSSVTQAGAALTPTAQTLWSFQPADTNRGPFQWVMGGAAFDSVFDPVMYLGYNVADGGGVAKSGEASFRTALESHYRNGGVNNFEYYFEYMSGDLVTRRRPFFLQMDKSTGAVNSMQFSANTAYFTQESDEAPYFTISRGNITSAPYAGTPIEWRIGAAASQSSVFAMENSEATALTIETLTTDSAVLRAGSALNENLYLFNDRGIAVNVQDNAAALTVKGGAVGSVAVFRGGAVAGNLTTWQDNSSSVLASVSSAGLATFAGVTLTDATNLAFSTSTGTKIGTATSQKIGFYNATPIIRPSGSILTALSSLGLVGSPTLASTALSDTANLAYLNVANTFAAAQFIDGSSDQIQLRVQGHSSQTADIFKVETSAGTKIGGWDQWGQLNTQYITDTTGVSPYFRFQTTSLMAINQGNAANVAFAVRGMAAQSGALTRWEDSSSTLLASVSAAGLGTFAGVASTTGTFSSDVSVGAGSAAVDSLLTINGGTNTGKGGAIAFKRGGSSKGYLGTRSFVIGGSTDDISLISYADLTLGIGSQILMAMSSSANTLNAYSSTAIPLVAKGFSAQTANLQEWQNSSATVLASVSSAGAATFNGVTVAAGYDINASHAAGVTNTRYGSQAMRVAASGTHNTCFGYYSMGALTSGSFNLAVGSTSLAALTTGSRNIGFGYGTFYNLQTGSDNTSVGMSALFSTTGSQNTAVGSGAGYYATSGSANIYLGYYAGLYATTQSNELFINSIDRTNRAGDIAGSIIYGVQSGTVANQTLALNASVTAEYGLRIGTNSGVLRLGTSGALYDRRAITNTYWGYSNSYRAILLGSASTNYNITDGASTIAINYDPSINAFGGFSGDGSEMIVRRGLTVCVPNSGDTLFKKTMTWRDGFVGINQTAPTSGLQIQPPDAASIGLRVLGFASQVSSLQRWEDSSGTALASVSAAGLGTFAGVTSNAASIVDGSADAIQLRVQAHSTQTAVIQSWESSAGTVLSAIDSAGAFVGGSVVAVKLWNRTVQGTGGGSLYLGGSATGAATDSVVLDGNASPFVAGVTSGEWSSLRVGHTNNPNASSTAIHNAIKINPVINYASGGTGSYNALRIAVTETALPSGANYLIHAAAGAAGTTEKFSVTNTGLGTFAGGVALADASDLTIGTTTGSKIGQASSKIGFFNATPVAKPTGVAVDAASIHAALVSLGLISA